MEHPSRYGKELNQENSKKPNERKLHQIFSIKNGKDKLEQKKDKLDLDKQKQEKDKLDLDKLQNTITKMQKFTFYENLQAKNAEEINELLTNKIEEDISIDDIVIDDNNKFIVKEKTILNRKKDREEKIKEGKSIKERIQNKDEIYDRLKDFHGFHIVDQLQKVNSPNLNALTDLVLWCLTQSEKKACVIDDKELAAIWDKVKNIWEDANEGANTNAVRNLLNYTQRYSKLKGLPSYEQRNFSNLFMKEINKINKDFFATISHYKERSFKKLMIETLGLEELRMQYLEEKYRSNGLDGPRGEEYREFKGRVKTRKQLHENAYDVYKAIKINKLAYEKVERESRELINKALKLKLPDDFKDQEKWKEFKYDIKAAEGWLESYSRIHLANEMMNLRSALVKLQGSFNKECQELKEILQKDPNVLWETVLSNISNVITIGSAL